nr:protein LTO1 homolog [Kogia breviceps]
MEPVDNGAQPPWFRAAPVSKSSVPKPRGSAAAARGAGARGVGVGGGPAAATAGSQDMFDAIVMAEERFHGEGYQEGYEEGSSLGMIEGKQYGTFHGAKIGSEITCYQGLAFARRCLLHGSATEKDSKKMKVLESLIGMIRKFPYADPTYDKLHEDLDRIRGKFKQLCSLLNVQPNFKISAEGERKKTFILRMTDAERRNIKEQMFVC